MTSHQLLVGAIVSGALALGVSACGGGMGMGYGSSSGNYMMPPTMPAQTMGYAGVTLVSDGAVMSAHVDRNLTNPWGIVFAPGAPVWIANNGSSTSTLYDGTGMQLSPTVTIPRGTSGNASPTGIVANTTTDFTINASVGRALFVFSSEGGTISAWAQANGSTAVTVYDDGTGGAVYKGLAIVNDGTSNFLLATDFHNNKIDVFDKNFAKVPSSGKFSDASMPAGFAPFGIQAIGSKVVVTYAKQQAPANHDSVAGAGLGYVNVFGANGSMVARLVSGGPLNAPWGIALAPGDFGVFSNALLIGNFGDGVINAFNASSGAMLGALMDPNGMTIVTPGLWGLAFGNGAMSQPTNVLFYTAGPNAEQDGDYGGISVATSGGMPMPGYGMGMTPGM